MLRYIFTSRFNLFDVVVLTFLPRALFEPMIDSGYSVFVVIAIAAMVFLGLGLFSVLCEHTLTKEDR